MNDAGWLRWAKPGPVRAGAPGVASNALALFLAYVLPRGCTFAAGIVAARVLGPERFGAYATAAAVAVVASITATLGMQPLLVRELSRDRAAAPALVGAAHGVKAITIALMAVVLVAAAFGTGLPMRVGLAALLLGAAYGVGALVDNLSAYFQAIERMYVWTQASALYGIIAGGVGIALVAVTGDLLAFCAAPLLGQLAALGWLLAASPATVRRPHAPRVAIVRPLLRQLAPFAVAFIATTIYYRGDVLLLARFRSDAEVGTYTVARRFLDVAQAVATAVAAAAYPRLARNRERREDRTRTGLQLALLAGVPAAGLLLLLREPLVSVLYGDGYSAAIPVLAILAPALAPLVLNMFCLAALAAADATATAARLWLAAAALNLALNALLVTTYGAPGAAAAALVSETMLAAGFLVAHARRGIRLRGAAVRAVVAAGALAVALAFLAPALAPVTAPAYLGAVAWVYRREGFLPRRAARPLDARAPEAA